MKTDTLGKEVKARVPNGLKKQIVERARVLTRAGRLTSGSDVVREALVEYFRKGRETA